MMNCVVLKKPIHGIEKCFRSNRGKSFNYTPGNAKVFTKSAVVDLLYTNGRDQCGNVSNQMRPYGIFPGSHHVGLASDRALNIGPEVIPYTRKRRGKRDHFIVPRFLQYYLKTIREGK